LLPGKRADLGQGAAYPARQSHLRRATGHPEGRDERHADDGADAALQDPEPVPGLGRLGQPAAATVLRVTRTTGRPPGRSPPPPGAPIAPMSQAGASSTARVEVPAPPCAPATTISAG
jgi:hypothetical protein